MNVKTKKKKNDRNSDDRKSAVEKNEEDRSDSIIR